MQAGPTATTTAGHRPLYSAGGIRLLSLVFNCIVGGAMAAQNLKDVQQPAAARVALGGSILYTGLTFYLLVRFSAPPLVPWLAWLAGILGGLALEAYASRFITDWQLLLVKSNLKPIGIYLLVVGLLFGLAFIAATPSSTDPATVL